jgi:hypothetical protein
MNKTYIPISIGINCDTRFTMQEALDKDHKIPYFPFDWCITGDLLDVARAINTKFKGYLSYIYVNTPNNKMDICKIKKILLEKKYITKKEAERKFGGAKLPDWKTFIQQIHKNYPSIIELHYDLANRDVLTKIQNRISRMNKVIDGKKPILFIRIIQPIQISHLPFFKYKYDEGLKNCHEFVASIKKIEFKLLYIHLSTSSNITMTRNETFGNIDAYEIKTPRLKNDSTLWEDFIIPYIKKYKLAIKL